MKYEKVKFRVGDEQFDVVHCIGDGQCKCKSCEEKGKYTVSWTSWFYKLSEDGEVMCGDCLRELLIQRRINEAVKKVLKDVGSISDDDDRFQYKNYQWFVDICKKYKIDKSELFPLKRIQKYDCTGCIWSVNIIKPKCTEYQVCDDCPNSSESCTCRCLEETPPEETECPYYKQI